MGREIGTFIAIAQHFLFHLKFTFIIISHIHSYYISLLAHKQPENEN